MSFFCVFLENLCFMIPGASCFFGNKVCCGNEGDFFKTCFFELLLFERKSIESLKGTGFMKKLTYSSLALVLLSCVGHFYLAQRSYQLTAGSAQASSICNINENINCDHVLHYPQLTAGSTQASSICNINENINCDHALHSPDAQNFDISISNFGFSVLFILSWTLYILLSFLQWACLFFLFKPELLYLLFALWEFLPFA